MYTPAQLYQLYLDGRRSFTPNQRQRLNSYRARLGQSTNSQGFPPLRNGQSPGQRFNVANQPFRAQRTAGNLFGSGSVAVSGSVNQNAFRRRINRPSTTNWNTRQNFNSDDPYTDLIISNPAFSSDTSPFLVRRKEFFMNVLSSNTDKPGSKDRLTRNIHPSNIKSIAPMAKIFSSWRLKAVSFEFHSYLGSMDVATIWAALDFDLHDKKPVQQEISYLTSSVNFTTSDRIFPIILPHEEFDKKDYLTDSVTDVHDTIRSLTPCRLITDAYYSRAGQPIIDHTVGYWNIEYAIELFHVRAPDVPQSDSVQTEDSDVDTLTDKVKCFTPFRKSK